MALFSKFNTVFGTSKKSVSGTNKEADGLRKVVLDMMSEHDKLKSQVSELVKRVENPDLYCGDCSNKSHLIRCRPYQIMPSSLPCCDGLKDDSGCSGRQLNKGHFGVLRDPNCPGYVPPVQPVSGDTDKPDLRCEGCINHPSASEVLNGEQVSRILNESFWCGNTRGRERRRTSGTDKPKSKGKR